MINEKKLVEELKSLQVTVTGIRAGKGVLNEYAKHFKDSIIKVIDEQPKVGEWIPCNGRLPEDCDERFYMCVVENHESDPPMYLQYLENSGFGLWNNVFDEHTLGFIDSVFSTNEELGYEKVVAWMPLPEPFKGDK